ncbi:MAG: metallophosphoesterase [Candidatus Zixiibacteriota bacterium]
MQKYFLLLFITVSFLGAMVNHPHSVVIDSIQSDSHDFPLRFIAFGDNYSVNSTFIEFIDYVNDHLADSIDFAMGVGDFAAGGELSKYNEYLDIIDGANFPILNTIGNHEVNDDAGEDNFIDIFGPSDYYFDYMDCRFIGLQNSHPASIPDISGEYMRYELTESQLTWYESLVSEWDGKVFAFMHAPPYLRGHITLGTMGGSGYNPYGSGPSGSDEFIRINRDHNVSMVFAGHLHCYDRWQPDDDIHGETVYFITGGAGAPINPWPYLAPYGGDFNHFMLIEVNEDGSVDGRIYKLGEEAGHDPDYDFHYDSSELSLFDEPNIVYHPTMTDAKAYQKGDEIYVKFGTPTRQYVRVGLYDVNGRIIERQRRMAGIGVSKFIFDLPIRSGIYMVRIQAENEEFTRKVNIVH